jgi:hypothetical protein
LSYRLPNKQGLFQPDLYKPFATNKPNSDFETWMKGEDKPANTLEITEDYRPVFEEGAIEVPKDPNVAALMVANKKIAELQETIKSLEAQGGSSNVVSNANAEPIIKEVKVEVVKEVPVEVIKEVIKEIEVPAKVSHNMNLQSKPTLGYWNIRGLGAPIRYLLHYCGVQFEDKTYAYGPGPEYDRSSWFNEKFTLGLELPNLPYLLDDDIKLTETVAIMKFVSSKWGGDLHSDPIANAQAEMMQDKVLNLKNKSTGPCYQGK